MTALASMREEDNAAANAHALAQLADAELLLQIAAGDEAAFECFYRRHYRRLYRFLWRLMGQEQLVEEVINDTMLVIWQTAERFEGRSQVSTWLLGIGYRKGIKQLKRRGLTAAASIDEVEIAAPGGEFERLDSQAVIADALTYLSPEHRAVIELAYFHGYSCGEIATLVQCPVNTVKTRLFHARARLREMLERDASHCGAELF